jgi:ornithine cyclodeaminase
MLAVRSIRQVRVWSRTAEHAVTFAKTESKRYGVEIEPLKIAQEAVTGADIVCTTTSANEPILFGDWLSPGMHINAVGSSVPFTRELDTAAILKARLFVDRRESTLNEAGDFLIPKQEGALTVDHIQGEIGTILLGSVSGRLSTGEITLFKSLGLAVEDVASAHAIYQKAVELGMGTAVEVGGSRQFGF